MSSALNEHIEYLSLTGRFDLFQSAFEKSVKPGDIVADLGCGVGVLGWQCLQVGAAKVFGIDGSDAIHLARETMVRAGLKDRYQCIEASTFDVELSEPVDLLVCDHIGYFGFDYGVIDMIRDASTRMLKPGGAIIPDMLKLSVAGVSSTTCRSAAAAWQADIVPAPYRWLDEQNRNSKFAFQLAPDQLCSAPEPLGEIELDSHSPKFFKFEATLEIARSGLFDGIAGWFDCHLGAGIWMTNSPVSVGAIKRPQAFFPSLKPFPVKRGDQIRVRVRFNSKGDLIAWTIDQEGSGSDAQELSTWNSTVLSPADLVAKSDQPLSLSQRGAARAFVLSHVDGIRTGKEIASLVLAQKPDLFPSEHAVRNFVEAVLARDCDPTDIN